ncbi:MAG: GreA/GreB family elongation factor [Chloroflexota bacterium]
MNDTRSPDFAGAVLQFLGSLPETERVTAQQAVYHFARWFGMSRSLGTLAPPEVANYAERLSLSDTDYSRKLERVRAFLLYARKEGWNRGNLSTHLRAKKVKARQPSTGGRACEEGAALTREGYLGLQAELASLKCRRLTAIDEVRRAAADKDVRENAPLEAAREEHGRITGRIRKLEEAIKSARVVGENSRAARKADVGSTLRLKSLDSGEEMVYTIVGPREVDPARGRISSGSPVGKALLGHDQGDTIEVVTPGGRQRYQVVRIES